MNNATRRAANYELALNYASHSFKNTGALISPHSTNSFNSHIPLTVIRAAMKEEHPYRKKPSKKFYRPQTGKGPSS